MSATYSLELSASLKARISRRWGLLAPRVLSLISEHMVREEQFEIEGWTDSHDPSFVFKKNLDSITHKMYLSIDAKGWFSYGFLSYSKTLNSLYRECGIYDARVQQNRTLPDSEHEPDYSGLIGASERSLRMGALGHRITISDWYSTANSAAESTYAAWKQSFAAVRPFYLDIFKTDLDVVFVLAERYPPLLMQIMVHDSDTYVYQGHHYRYVNAALLFSHYGMHNEARGALKSFEKTIETLVLKRALGSEAVLDERRDLIFTEKWTRGKEHLAAQKQQ
jgi:hypothetical protein